METPGRSMPPTRDDDDDDDEMTSPFDMIRSVPRTAMGHSVTPKVPRRPSIEVVDVLPGKTRIVFACMLPLLMIAATFALQKKVHARPRPHHATLTTATLTITAIFATTTLALAVPTLQVMLNAGSPLRHRERSVFDRNNALLLNRSCAPQLQSAVLRAGPLPSDVSDSVRLVVGGGFAASGLSAVASMIQNVPGACHPGRVRNPSPNPNPHPHPHPNLDPKQARATRAASTLASGPRSPTAPPPSPRTRSRGPVRVRPLLSIKGVVALSPCTPYPIPNPNPNPSPER